MGLMGPMERYICIHGHFYQPPRENAWLEFVELQDSAYPFHDWNERITAECYAANGTSRILDGYQNIEKITNNYAHISFNFGPTLLEWMAEKEPETYRTILEADKESRQRFSGHGSAIAQAYNHTILPLSNSRDKYTQILWGIRDFEFRFGRKPEGMWLPETAVDLEVLDVLLAKLGRGTDLWQDASIELPPEAPSHWMNILTSEEPSSPVSASALFSTLPLAVLTARDHGPTPSLPNDASAEVRARKHTRFKSVDI